MITAPAASTGIALLLQATLPGQLRATGQPVRSVTVHPLPESDSRGLVGFYTVVGWAIAGYLGATLFGLTFGTRIGHRKTLLRLGALVITGLVVGLGGTLVANAIGGMGAPWLAMTLLGALVIITTGAITVALQSLLGVAGTGLAILLFVILGNPSSGGPSRAPADAGVLEGHRPAHPRRRRRERLPRHRLFPGRAPDPVSAHALHLARRRRGRGAAGGKARERHDGGRGRRRRRRGDGALRSLMRLATWNVNSLPARMPRVLDWLHAAPRPTCCACRRPR